MGPTAACIISSASSALLLHVIDHPVHEVTFYFLQSRLSQIQSVLVTQLVGDAPVELSALSPDVQQAAGVCGIHTPAAAAAAWAIGIALPPVPQPPPLLPRSIQLLCVVLANFSSWYDHTACNLRGIVRRDTCSKF